MGESVFIGVGSNHGDRRGNIEASREALERERISVIRCSPVYETPALCRPGETMPDFFNAVFEVRTGLGPEALLEKLEEVERELGRMEKGGWRPRTIDLDLLLYGDRIIDTERLRVPHPEMAKRWFVLKPLADLAPDLVHPVQNKTIKEMLCKFSSTQPT